MTQEDQIIDAVLGIALDKWRVATSNVYSTEMNGHPILLVSIGHTDPYLTVNGIEFHDSKRIIELKNRLEIEEQRESQLRDEKNVSEIFNALCT